MTVAEAEKARKAMPMDDAAIFELAPVK